MRDRLIELIRKARKEMQKEELTSQLAREYFIAEYLLANGVIVPQVNVGDKLYYISGVGKIVENEVWYVGAFAKGTCYTEEGTPILTSVFLDCDANRHYYFTKEEAEKALAERSGE